MILYLYGPDSYRRSRVLSEKILGAYNKKHPNGSVSYFDLDKEGELDKAVGLASNTGLFALVKLLVLMSPQKAEDKELANFLKNYLEDKKTTIVLVSDKKLGKKFDFLLKAPAQSWEFGELKGKELLAFVKARAKKMNLELSAFQTKALVELFGSDLWGIAGEVEKMALGGDVAESVVAPEFIDLIKGFVYGRDPGSRLRALHYLLVKNDAGAVFNMAAAWAGGRRKIDFADYDVAVKSGKLEVEEALLGLALAS